MRLDDGLDGRHGEVVKPTELGGCVVDWGEGVGGVDEEVRNVFEADGPDAFWVVGAGSREGLFDVGVDSVVQVFDYADWVGDDRVLLFSREIRFWVTSMSEREGEMARALRGLLLMRWYFMVGWTGHALPCTRSTPTNDR